MGAKIHILEMKKNKKFIFNTNLLVYTKNIDVSKEMKISEKGFLVTKCSGEGKIFYYCEGESIPVSLDENETIYIKSRHVVAYDESVTYDKFITYGNKVASLGMDFHYKFTGPGNIIVQSQSMVDDFRSAIIEEDGSIKIFLQENIPFGKYIFK